MAVCGHSIQGTSPVNITRKIEVDADLLEDAKEWATALAMAQIRTVRHKKAEALASAE